MARLENGSYEEIVAHFERKLVLNALEESDDLPVAAMTSSTSNQKKLSLQWTTDRYRLQWKRAIWSKTVKTVRRKKNMPKMANQPRRKHTSNVGIVICGTETNQPGERCWQGAGAHLRSKRTRSEDSSDSNPASIAPKAHHNHTSSRFLSTFKKEE